MKPKGKKNSKFQEKKNKNLIDDEQKKLIKK